MADKKIYSVVNSLNSGEISELIDFRDDIGKYKSACLTMENWIPLVEGGAKRMPGTYFCGATKYGGCGFLGSIAGGTLTVTAIYYGSIQVGETIYGNGVTTGTVIQAFGVNTSGGVGTYTLNHSQSVSSEQMMAESLYPARLVPFVFNNEQAYVLEIGPLYIRVWYNGGLLLGFPPATIDYDPATAYAVSNTVLIGSYVQVEWDYIGFPSRYIFICAPYGQSSADSVNITISLNSADTLVVAKTGIMPNQGISIQLANATPSNNAASVIQAAIRALISLNSKQYNYVDLSKWTVTPDTYYYATPAVIAPTVQTSWIVLNKAMKCLQINQYDRFPPYQYLNYWDYTASATSIVELVTPYKAADIFDLDISNQSADFLYIYHEDYPPATVSRLSAYSFQYDLQSCRGTSDVIKSGYSGIGQAIVDISNTAPALVVVANPTQVFNTNDRIYINGVVGMAELNEGEYLVYNPTFTGNGDFMFSMKDPDTGTPINSTGFLVYQGGGVVVPVVPMFDESGDYPACGVFYEQRLCVGGTINDPTQINGSVQEDYPNYICDPSEADYAIQFTLVSQQVDRILVMIGSPTALVLGTEGGVWTIAGTNSGSLAQTNVDTKKQSTIGVGRVQPQLVNDSAIFVSASKKIVIFMLYNFVTNQWDNIDLTRLNRNITLGANEALSGIVQTAFQTEPYPVFWAVRADGQLIGLVFNRQDQVFAWFRINMTDELGYIESATRIPQGTSEEQISVAVRRTINGIDQRYFEYFMPHEIFNDLSNAFLVHSGQTLTELPAVAITAITQASPCKVTAPNHGLTTGATVTISGVLGMTQINQDPTEAYTITVFDANNIFLLIRLPYFY